MRLGILGGTFDPVHNGHLAAARAAARVERLDRVLLVPAGRPWHRDAAPIASPQQRLDMVRLAVEDDATLRASSLDIERAGDTYAVDLLRDVREAFADAELVLIVGADAYAQLHTWRSPDLIRELADIAVVTRAAPAGHRAGTSDVLREVETAQSIDKEDSTSPVAMGAMARSHRVIDVSLTGYDISATEVRRRCAAGQSIEALVPLAVADYIRSHGLYQ